MMERSKGSGAFPWLMAALSLLLLIGLCLLVLGILHRPAPAFHPPPGQYKALVPGPSAPPPAPGL